jgi:aldehyde:ferredoxin oxidoreductase
MTLRRANFFPARGLADAFCIQGPEYETIYAFGGLCEIERIEEILYLNDLCDTLGLDTISAGNLAAFAIEASKQGRITLKLDYGDVDGIAELLKDIAFCRITSATGDGAARGSLPKWGRSH